MAQAQTESTSSTYVPTIDTVVAQSYRRAGLLNQLQSPTAVQASLGRELLSNIVDALQPEGVLMRAIQYGYVTLAQGQNAYTMSENILDLVGDGAYVMPTDNLAPFQALSEIAVLKIDRDTWQNISAKGAQALPTLYYFAREAPQSTLYLWPTPSNAESGGKIRFQQHQVRPDVTNGNNTLPFERYWTDYFVWELAFQLAMDSSMDLTRVGALATRAGALKEKAKGYSKQNVSMQASIGHKTNWGKARRR